MYLVLPKREWNSTGASFTALYGRPNEALNTKWCVAVPDDRSRLPICAATGVAAEAPILSRKTLRFNQHMVFYNRFDLRSRMHKLMFYVDMRNYCSRKRHVRPEDATVG